MSLSKKSVRESFEQVKPIANVFAERFFENLNTDYPVLNTLFKSENKKTQQQIFQSGFVFLMDNLENESYLRATLKNWGQLLSRCGMEEKHYEWVKKTLLKSLSQFFLNNWNAELEQQWTEAFNYAVSHLSDNSTIDVHAEVRTEAKSGQNPDNVIPFPENSENSNRKVISKGNLSLELPSHLKEQIREEAKRVVREALQTEIESAIKEELNSLGGTVSQLFRKVAC